ncbi:MAG: NAD(P)/FAD-dependent oxidoreductase [Candidatus Methanomethylophilaceae archaeon]
MDTEVFIVGAGPSGLSAALYLSSEGTDVTVADRMSRETYDRYHSICGAGISGRAFSKLELIEPCHVRNRVERGELIFPGGVKVTLPVDGYVLDRPAFLKELRDRCADNGCRFVHDTAVSVTRTDGGFLTAFRSGDSISSHRIIGCDGAHSVVRKDLFGWRPREMIPTTECIVRGRSEPMFRMEMGERYCGMYRWEFPSGDMVSIGSVKGAVDTSDAVHIGSRMIPIGAEGPIEKDGAYLCGDSAGMPNPVCAGGLMAGMLSGQECARSILSGESGRYQRWWDRSILSSERFMMFHDRIKEWDDEEFIRASRPFRGCRNIYLTGIKALLTQPRYAREYIGCLQTFRHSW